MNNEQTRQLIQYAIDNKMDLAGFTLMPMVDLSGMDLSCLKLDIHAANLTDATICVDQVLPNIHLSSCILERTKLVGGFENLVGYPIDFFREFSDKLQAGPGLTLYGMAIKEGDRLPEEFASMDNTISNFVIYGDVVFDERGDSWTTVLLGQGTNPFEIEDTRRYVGWEHHSPAMLAYVRERDSKTTK